MSKIKIRTVFIIMTMSVMWMNASENNDDTYFMCSGNVCHEGAGPNNAEPTEECLWYEWCFWF
jgi:hypothetical protein